MKYILLLVVFSGFMTKSEGQVNFIASYPISFPIGNMSDYVEKTSFRGLSLEVNAVHNEKIEYGVETTWNVFFQKEDEKVYNQGTASIKGVQYRYVNAVPLLAQVKYTGGDPKSSSRFAPYGGIGIGTLYVDQATDFGLYRISNEAWQFCLRPQIGLKLKNDRGPGGFVGLKYYVGFKSDDMDGQSYLSLNIGIIFPSGK